MHKTTLLIASLFLAGCASTPPTVERFDLLIRNGLVYDGSGAQPAQVDVAVNDDRVVKLLPHGARADARTVIDAEGRAVAPGFINVLSWATESLIADGRGMSDTKQA